MSSLEEVAKEAGLPFGMAAASQVKALSAAYNQGEATPHSLAARLAFFFARDVPKAEAAVRELVLTKTLELSSARPLRVLDLGAGLGAATWGVARALRDRSGRIEATLVDRDRSALDLAMSIAKRRRHEEGALTLGIETVVADVMEVEPRGADLVIAENVLAEISGSIDEDADRLERWLRLVREDGSLVIIEPALRGLSRHLHEVRDRLASRKRTIFAPCLHERSCPALAKPNDWCHEDLPVNLPEPLVAVARAAGLRWQGLTFSYLILRRDEKTLASHVPGGSFRVVSSLIRTKGKREAHLCGKTSSGKAMRLDRDASAKNRAFDHVERGDLIDIDPAPEEKTRFRIGDGACVIDVGPKRH